MTFKKGKFSIDNKEESSIELLQKKIEMIKEDIDYTCRRVSTIDDIRIPPPPPPPNISAKTLTSEVL